jgi:hypothetical protein
VLSLDSSFRNGQLLAPITVGETEQDATETELQLRPITRPYEKEAKWYEARMFSFRKDRWTENFRAEFQAHFDEKYATEVDGGQETELQRQLVRNHIEQASSGCAEAINTEAFYEYCTEYDSKYGESFQLLDEIRWDGHGTTAARINMASAKSHYPPADSPVHPNVLDATIHLLFSHLSKGLKEPIPTLAPQRFASFWVSSKLWDQETSSIRVVNQIRKPNTFSTSIAVETDIYALADDGSPLGILKMSPWLSSRGPSIKITTLQATTCCMALHGSPAKHPVPTGPSGRVRCCCSVER